MDLNPEQTFLGIKLAHIGSGAVGGVLRALVAPKKGVLQTMASTIAGVLVAGYMTPTMAALADKYGFEQVPDPSLEGTVGFLLGLTGMSLCETALRLIARWRWPPTAPCPGREER